MKTQQHMESRRLQSAVWNTCHQNFPQNRYLPELVAAQATATPDAIAVVADQDVLSYRELNSRANQLAHYLQELGVRPDMLVGCCVNRSVELIVALLGILKAG